MWASALTAQKCLGSYHFFKTNSGQWFHRAIPEDFSFFSKIRQTKVCEITRPLYQGRNLGSALCVLRLSIPLGSRPVLTQTPHKTFSLRMLPVQAPCQREEKIKNRELTWHLRHYQCPNVYTGSGFSNELVQSSVMHEGKRDTQKQTHGKSSDSHIVERRLVVDSATFLSSEASLVLETSLQIKALT